MTNYFPADSLKLYALRFTNGNRVVAREDEIDAIRAEYSKLGHALVTCALIVD